MLTAIDHVILATPNPDHAAADIGRALGLHVAGGGRHEAHGTYNRLIWLGDSYIELMGVFDPQLAADSWWGSHLSRVLSGAAAGLAGVVFASSDLDADIELLRSRGTSISDPIPGERVRPDGDVVRWRIGRLPAPDPELGLTFLIEHDTDAAEWLAADRAARATDIHPLGSVVRLVRVEVPVADVARASLWLLRQLGLQFRPSLAGGGARDATVGAQVLRLTPALPGRVPVIVLRGGPDPLTVDLLGVRWEFLPL